MAWSKVSTTTKAWNYGPGVEDVLSDNGYAADGTSVLQQYITFLGTRGWTGGLTPVITTASATITDYNYYIQKTAVCEDGSSVIWGFNIRYRCYSDSTDSLYMYPWEPASDVTGSTAFFLADVGNDIALPGKWSFWVSDEDSDSFAVIPGEGSARRCIGFWPHSGDMFAQGYQNTNFPMYSGIKPLFASTAASWEGAASNGKQNLIFRNGGHNGSSSGMNPQAFKLDYAWVLNGYSRPIFRSFGSDIHSYHDPSAYSQAIFASNAWTYVDTMKIGDIYYIGIGYHQRLLLEVGTVPPIL